MSQSTALAKTEPGFAEQAHVDALAVSEGFVSFRFGFFAGELIVEFVREDYVPYAFSELGLERRLNDLARAKHPNGFTKYVLAQLKAKKAEATL